MNKLFSLFLLLSFGINAQITLPHIFSDNMVLQRESKVPVWGWSKPNESISVSFHNQKVKTKADAKGNWKIVLQPENAGGPFQLTIKGKKKIVFNNVLVGDVWLAGGQSNMEWTVEQSDNYLNEQKNANYANIRHIKIPRDVNTLPQNNVQPTHWDTCTPETFGKFSGVGYYFAKELNQKTNIPIGILNASWGGSMVEAWISREGFENHKEFQYLNNTFINVDFNELKKIKIEGIEKLQNKKIDAIRFDDFIQTQFDDTSLPHLIQPTGWENQSIGSLDGLVWIRKTIYLDENQVKEKAILSLSRIDDEDVTYVNGVKVGENKMWNAERIYDVPQNILKVGKNVIAIKITDTGGGGGLWGEPENVYLQLGTNKVSLVGEWKYFINDVFITKDVNTYQTMAYNAMIHPLVDFPVKGFIWYQGETNAPRAYQYRKAFPLLINDWRNKWHNENLPFYFVQLATYKTIGDSNSGCDWAELREAQTLTLNVPHTGMVVTTDVGNPKDIHPTNKETVGKRMALIALNNDYGQNNLYKNPSYDKMEIIGDKIYLYFNDTAKGLIVKDGTAKGFELASDNKIFQKAEGIIAKDNNQKDVIVIQIPEGMKVKSVRFGWIGDASQCNVFNSEGLPLIPFRTDDWEISTYKVKFTN